MITQPKYQHDCDSCVFLGRTIGNGHGHDLYYHVSPSYTTVIARYGNEGREYVSSPVDLIEVSCCHAELWVAKSLWKQKINSEK